MDKKILDKIKETLDNLDNSYEIQKEIRESEEKLNEQEKKYKVEKESFDKEFPKENPNNPVYMDRRNSKMNELEKLNKEIQDGKNLVEVKKSELKEKFNKNKEEILKQVEDRREEMKRNYEDYKTGLIKKEDMSRKIETLKKDMENKSAVALDIMKPMLQQKEEKLQQINDEIINVENPEAEKDFDELSDIEDVLKRPDITLMIEGLANIYETYKTQEEKDENVEQPAEIINEDIDKPEEEKDENVEQPKEIINENIVKPEKIMYKDATTINSLNDLEYGNGQPLKEAKEFFNKLEEIKQIQMKINKRGVLEYIIEDKKNNKEISKINPNKYRKYLKKYEKITKELDEKNIIDPFLVYSLGKKLGNNISNENIARSIIDGIYDKDNNRNIIIGYDMSDLKKVKGIRNRMHLRNIARGATKQDFLVWGYKETIIRRIIDKAKGISNKLEQKKEMKRITDGNKEEKHNHKENGKQDKNRVIRGYSHVKEKFIDFRDDLAEYKEKKYAKQVQKQEKKLNNLRKKHDEFAKGLKFNTPKVSENTNKSQQRNVAEKELEK